MEKENYYELLKELLLELYFKDGIIPNIDYKAKNKIITDIDEDYLIEKLKTKWKQNLGCSINFYEFENKFKEEFVSWKKQLNEFENVKNKSEMASFLKSNFQRNYHVGYKLGEVSKNDIKKLLEYKKPKISKDFKGSVYRFDNFLIYTNESLHISLHLKLDDFRYESFLFTVIFSFWIEEPDDPFSLDMNYINSNYNNLIIARDVMNKLEVNNYVKMDLFDFEKYNTQSYQNTEMLNDWVEEYPHFFITYAKQILNANPTTLIDEIIDDLQVFKYEKEGLENHIQSPTKWFQNLSRELQLFYSKGKELFLKTSRLVDADSKESSAEIEEGETKGRKEKLTVEDFIFLFEKAMDKDLDEGVAVKDAGYRTFLQLFNEFLDKNKREKKHEYIESVSRGTFYNLISKYKEELEAILDKNPEKGQGGGDAYRIVRVDTEKHYETEISIKDHISEETLKIKEKIHEGLTYYKHKSYEEAIELYLDLLNTEKDELKRINDDYLGVLYYLGKSYMKQEEYKHAMGLFDEIYENDKNKIDAGFRLLVCLYNLKEYQNSKDLVLDLHSRLINIIKPYKSVYRKEILYRDEWRYNDIKKEDIHPNIYNRDIFTKNLLMLNREVQFYDFYSLQPQWNGAWEEYKKKKDLYEKIRYFLNLNLYAFRKLMLLRFSIENYLTEIFRKTIFNSLLINDDEKTTNESLHKIIEYIKPLISERDLKLSKVNDFLIYLVRLLNIYYSEENNEISEYIHSNFPNLGDKIIGYKYISPKNTRSLRMFLYYTASAMKSGNFRFTQEEIEKEINQPDLLAEIIIIELLNILNLGLEKYKEQVQTNLDQIDAQDRPFNLSNFNQWQYSRGIAVHRGIDFYRNQIEIYKEYCAEHGLELYSKKLQQISTLFEEKLTEIGDIKKIGRKRVFHELFKIYHNSFKIEKEEHEIDYSEKQEDHNFDYILAMIQNQIFSLRNLDFQEMRIIVKLFDKKITKEIHKAILDKIKLPNIILLDLNQNQIQLTYFKTVIPSNIPIDFGKYLDYFFWDFFDCFEINTDRIVFRYIAEFEERLKDYFKNQFVEEFENPYFKFELEHNPEELYYFITIKKQEVK